MIFHGPYNRIIAPFAMEEYLAQPSYREGSRLCQTDVTVFVVSWEVSPSLISGWVWDGEKVGRAREGEWEETGIGM